MDLFEYAEKQGEEEKEAADLPKRRKKRSRKGETSPASGQETATTPMEPSDPEIPIESDTFQDSIFSVSDLTIEIKKLLKAKYGREGLWVKGELSNFRGANQSGHMYFRLKDERAVLNCVFFRNANRKVDFELKEGMEILAFGRIDLWEKGGNYQLVVESVRPGGAGELYLRFEQLKKKLEAEGLFSVERKKPLPEFASRIGVITSPTGAVIRDVIHVTQKRCPFVELLLHPVKVQGEGAAEEISAAIRSFTRLTPPPDLLIVGRGGGSIEDLWAFNEEIVARAIADCPIPVISAVGHQTDFTIADFVADVRAATPSQAAEYAVPNIMEVKRRVDQAMAGIVREIIHSKEVSLRKLESLQRNPILRDPRLLIRDREQRVELAMDRAIDLIRGKKQRNTDRFARARDQIKILLPRLILPRKLRFEKAASNLNLLSPLAILSRGYSVVTNASRKIVKAFSQVKKGDQVFIRLHQGELHCEVKQAKSGDAPSRKNK